MRKIATALSILALVSGCAKRDPILPGERTAIFEEDVASVTGGTFENLPAAAVAANDAACPYTQDKSNVIWNGDKKIFSGFPTSNSVKSTQKPVCAGKYVVAGLTTGEVVKVNPANRQIVWIADIFRPSNMTGGASVLDIVAPIIIDKDAVYAGGMGDAFCRLNLSNGKKKWCTPISVSVPFVVAGPASFVMATNGMLHGVRNTDGAIVWQREIGKCDNISYADGRITACKIQINASTGQVID